MTLAENNADLDADVLRFDRRQERAKRRFTPVHWSELEVDAKRDALIEGVLDAETFSVWFGASGAGKSFLLIDVGGHIAAGYEWRGRSVKQGRVVYIAAEGGRRFKERVIAFAYHHELDRDAVPFHVIGEAPDLCHKDNDTDELLAALAELPSDPPIVLIIVDTISRALAGGNENSSDDMGAFVRNCDRIRQETGAHVAVVHHTGKDEGRGARGHSLLKAAADTEIEISGDVEVASTAKVTKQRDYPGGESLSYKLHLIEVGEDGRTAGVAVPADDGRLSTKTTDASKGRRLTKAASIALRALKQAADEVGSIPPASNNIPPNTKTVNEEQWRKYAFACGVSTGGERAQQRAFQRGSQALIADGQVGAWQGYHWPCS